MKPRPPDQDWYRTADAAAYVGLGEDSFRAVVKSGAIPRISGPGHPRYLRSRLLAWMEANTPPVQTAQPAPTRLRPVPEPPTDKAADLYAAIRQARGGGR